MKLKDNAYSLLYHTEQLKAVHAKLNDTPDLFYRKVCRWYSSEFHTPLKDVWELPYHELLKHYYENAMDKMNYNEALEYAKSELLDVFVDRDEEQNKEFALELEKEQAATIKKKADKKAAEEAQLQTVEDDKKALEKEQAKTTVKIPDINMSFEDDGNENE